MTRDDLASQLAATGLSHTLSRKAVDLFFGEMSNTLATGGRVLLKNFISIETREKKTIRHFNRKTKTYSTLPAKRVVIYRYADQLKAKVNVSSSKGTDQ